MSQQIDPNPKSEMVLYVAILAIGAFVRLYRLGLAPLSANEAAQALAAWHGTPPPSGASPLLYAINSVLFGLLGTSDGLARLGAAISGTALVGIPVLLRHRLGRAGALGAAFVLAISPSLIVASRTLSGEIVVALVSLGLLAAGDHYLQTHSRNWMYTIAALLALGLTSGCGIFTLAIIFAGILGLWRLIGESTSNPSTTLPHPRDASGGNGGSRRTSLQLEWKRLAIVVATSVLGLSTVLLWRPAGLSAVGNLLPAWLYGFRLSAGTTSWYLPFQILIFYESLALLAGLAGLAIASVRSSLSGIFLGYWAAIAVFLIALRQGRAPQDMALAIVPLACLAGYVFEQVVASFRRWHASSLELAFTVILLVLFAFGLLGLADYAVNPNAVQSIRLANQAWTVHRSILQIFLMLSLLGVTLLLMAGLQGIESTLLRSALAVLIALAACTWAAGWGATQLRPGDPRELLAGPQPTSPATRSMVKTLETISELQTGESHSLALVVVTSSPARDSIIAWTLRDFPKTRFVPALDERSAPYTVIAPFDMTPELASSYTGQEFAVYTTWNWRGHTTAESLRWLLYRWSPDTPMAEENIVIWVQQEETAMEATP